MQRFRVIFAVFKKDLIELTRYKTWIISLFIWPLIMPLIYILSAYALSGGDTSGVNAFKDVAGTGNYQAYIVIGTLVWQWVNSIMWGFGTYLRNEQNRGTLESNWLCPIKRIDFLIGGGLKSLLIVAVYTIIAMVEYDCIYGITFKGSLPEWLLLFLIIMPAAFGIGMFFASLILWAKQANSAVNVVRGIVMILCGISFPITVMPPWMQTMSNLLPFTHGIEAARIVMVNGESLSQAKNSIILCLIEGIILIILGRIAFMFTEMKVRESGSLERF